MVVLDAAGRLVELRVMPSDGGPPPAAVDWQPLLAATGLSTAALRAVSPAAVPPLPAEQRAAWEGSFAEGLPPVRVETGAFAGRPVWLRVLGPWASAPTPSRTVWSGRFSSPVAITGILVTLLVAPVMVMRNLRRGRVDRRAALRLAAVSFAVLLLGGIARMHHQEQARAELLLFGTLLAHTTFLAIMVWGLYVAVEPYVRKRWPQTLIAWSRLVGGRARDPLVGRELLVGLLAGAVTWLLVPLTQIAEDRLGLPTLYHGSVSAPALASGGALFYFVCYFAFAALAHGLGFLFFLVLLRVLLRSNALAAVALCALLLLPLAAVDPVLGWMDFVRGGLAAAIFAWLLTRHGLLAVIAALYAGLLAQYLPLTLDGDAWYFGRSALVLLGLGALALWSCRVALGQQPLWRPDLLDG
jgi:serine/threonine-protein kinase